VPLSQVIAEIFPDLERFGWRVATDIYTLHHECELSPPQLKCSDAWGNRVDNIITSPAWKQMKHISAEEGLVAIAYERKYAEWRFLYCILCVNYLRLVINSEVRCKEMCGIDYKKSKRVCDHQYNSL